MDDGLDLFTALSGADRQRLLKAAEYIQTVLGKSPESQTEGYYLRTRVAEGKVFVYLLNNGKLVSAGFSHIREGTYPNPDEAMAQAFSYAAHMAYKHSQWNGEFSGKTEEPLL